MSGDNRSLYEVLGVSKKYNALECMNKYNKYVRKNHPSKLSEDSGRLLELRKVIFAFRVLTKPELRELYDRDGLAALNDKVTVPYLLLPMYDKSDMYDLFALMCIRSRKYPAEDVKANNEGTVIVNYVISTDGSVKDPVVAHSSSFESLDREAVKAVLAAGKKARKHLIPAYSLVNGKPVEISQEVMVPFYTTGGMNGKNHASTNYKGYNEKTGGDVWNKPSVSGGYRDGMVSGRTANMTRETQDRQMPR